MTYIMAENEDLFPGTQKVVIMTNITWQKLKTNSMFGIFALNHILWLSESPRGGVF